MSLSSISSSTPSNQNSTSSSHSDDHKKIQSRSSEGISIVSGSTTVNVQGKKTSGCYLSLQNRSQSVSNTDLTNESDNDEEDEKEEHVNDKDTSSVATCTHIGSGY